MRKDIFEKYNPEDEEILKWKKVPYQKDDLRLLKKLFAVSSRKPTRVGSLKTKSTFYKDFPKNQRVIFKATHSKLLKAHNVYLNTYMPQIDKDEVTNKPELFGTDPDAYEQNKVPFHHKFIITPENPNIDLKVMAEVFIERVEKLTGYKLNWRAAIHRDKEHPHLHLCLNGRDLQGKKVYFPKEFIKRTFRETLSCIATQMVGERTRREILQSQKNIHLSKRWTKLDEKIESLNRNTFPEKRLPFEIRQRLNFLCTIGLSQYSDGVYTLNNDWKDTLIATGRYNTYLTEYLYHNGNLELYNGNTVSGKVIKSITFDRDESWNDALIIQNENGKNIYIPAYQITRNYQDKYVVIQGGKRTMSRQITDKDIKIRNKNEIQL